MPPGGFEPPTPRFLDRGGGKAPSPVYRYPDPPQKGMPLKASPNFFLLGCSIPFSREASFSRVLSQAELQRHAVSIDYDYAYLFFFLFRERPANGRFAGCSPKLSYSGILLLIMYSIRALNNVESI